MAGETIKTYFDVLIIISKVVSTLYIYFILDLDSVLSHTVFYASFDSNKSCM